MMPSPLLTEERSWLHDLYRHQVRVAIRILRHEIFEDLLRKLASAYWSTYWYHGRIYGTEIARGLDVFALTPSQFLSESEIAAAARADGGGVFNPQQQFPVQWPAEPVVARAYLDQLERGGELSESFGAQLTVVLDRSEAQLQDGGSDEDLAAGLETLAATLNENPGHGAARKREAALSQTLWGIAARLR